jgi:ADP-ribosyl-[dinitrogen reductase] hydrolase
MTDINSWKLNRTSATHPLRIDTIHLKNGGKLGLSFCPGKKQFHGMTGAWVRDLDTDISAINDWGGSVIITLLEDHELIGLQVTEIKSVANQYNIDWLHLPTPNDLVPDESFLQNWRDNCFKIHELLNDGKNVFIHCMGGIGRTSVLAAIILIERGYTAEEAIKIIKDTRENSFCIPEQVDFVLSLVGL